MAELVDVIMAKIRQAAHLRHRLVVVSGAYGVGRSRALHEVALQTGAPLIDLHSFSSDGMRLRQRLGEIVNGTVGDLILLDGVEILFHSKLRNPFRLLQDLARGKTVAVAGDGLLSDGHTISAPDGKTYPVRGFLVANPEADE